MSSAPHGVADGAPSHPANAELDHLSIRSVEAPRAIDPALVEKIAALTAQLAELTAAAALKAEEEALMERTDAAKARAEAFKARAEAAKAEAEAAKAEAEAAKAEAAAAKAEAEAATRVAAAEARAAAAEAELEAIAFEGFFLRLLPDIRIEFHEYTSSFSSDHSSLAIEDASFKKLLDVLPPLTSVEKESVEELCDARWEEFKRLVPRVAVDPTSSKFEEACVQPVVESLLLAAKGVASDLKVRWDVVAQDEIQAGAAAPAFSVTAAPDAHLSIRSTLLMVDVKRPGNLERAVIHGRVFGLQSVWAQCQEKCCVWQDPEFDASSIFSLVLVTDGWKVRLLRVDSGAPPPGGSYHNVKPGVTRQSPELDLLPGFDFNSRVPPAGGATPGFELLVRLLSRGVHGLQCPKQPSLPAAKVHVVPERAPRRPRKARPLRDEAVIGAPTAGVGSGAAGGGRGASAREPAGGAGESDATGQGGAPGLWLWRDIEGGDGHGAAGGGGGGDDDDVDSEDPAEGTGRPEDEAVVELNELVWLGSGGSSNVFRCRLGGEDAGDDVVLKVIRSESRAPTNLFEAEVGFLRRLQRASPTSHIPTLIHQLQWKRSRKRAAVRPCPMLLLRPCGEALGVWARRQGHAVGSPERKADANRVLAGVLEALKCAHALGIVHCDVRSANVVIAADEAVLVDWGLALDVGRETGGRGVEAYAADFVFAGERYNVNPSVDLVAAAYLWLSIAFSEACTAPWRSETRGSNVRASRREWMEARTREDEDVRKLNDLVRTFGSDPKRIAAQVAAWPL